MTKIVTLFTTTVVLWCGIGDIFVTFLQQTKGIIRQNAIKLSLLTIRRYYFAPDVTLEQSKGNTLVNVTLNN